jgi:hypothetical protein
MKRSYSNLHVALVLRSLMSGIWKLSVKPWIRTQGPEKGKLESVTVRATSGRITRNILLPNHGLHLDQLRASFRKILSNELVPGILTMLRKDNGYRVSRPVYEPSAFPTPISAACMRWRTQFDQRHIDVEVCAERSGGTAGPIEVLMPDEAAKSWRARTMRTRLIRHTNLERIPTW